MIRPSGELRLVQVARGGVIQSIEVEGVWSKVVALGEQREGNQS